MILYAFSFGKNPVVKLDKSQIKTLAVIIASCDTVTEACREEVSFVVMMSSVLVRKNIIGIISLKFFVLKINIKN